jgi:hypothetical protein
MIYARCIDGQADAANPAHHRCLQHPGRRARTQGEEDGDTEQAF